MCFERLLTLATPLEFAIETCIEAAAQMELLRYSQYSRDSSFSRIKALVEKYTLLRWKILEDIVHRDTDPKMSLLEQSNIVRVTMEDLDELVLRATNVAVPLERRRVWFWAGKRLIFSNLKASKKQAALSRFVVGTDAVERQEHIRGTVKFFAEQVQSMRDYKKSQREAEFGRRAVHEKNIEVITGNLDRIRAGDHHHMVQLVNYLFGHLRATYFEQIDFTEVRRHFSAEIASALYEGLAVYLSLVQIPDPLDATDGHVLGFVPECHG